MFVFLGSVLCLIGVAMGAFGAHALKSGLSVSELETFKTGVQYHQYHALAIVAIALGMARVEPEKPIRTALWLFVAGIGIFAGSLYLLATLHMPVLGAITPIGGACFIGGWLLVAIRFLPQSSKSTGNAGQG